MVANSWQEYAIIYVSGWMIILLPFWKLDNFQQLVSIILPVLVLQDKSDEVAAGGFAGALCDICLWSM